MSSLYAAEELMSTKQYLISVYGNRVPAPDEIENWKMSEIEMYMRSDLFGISNYFRIPNKEQEIVALRPMAGQAILDVCIECQRRKGLPQRVAGFKSRQVGWSTWMLARTVKYTSSRPNRRGMFLVPDEDVAAVMATRAGSMLNGLPRFMQPMRRIQNLKHVVFDNPNPKERSDNPGLNSEFQITVPSSMRGIPPQMLTVSEYSHMDPSAQLAVTSSILPAMPLSEHSCVVIDTTPNGFDDFYYPMVMEAAEENPKWLKRLEMSNRAYTAEQILAGELGEPENPYSEAFMLAFERWDWHEEYSVRSRDNPRGEARKPPPKIWAAFLDDLGHNNKYGGAEELDLHDRFGVHPEKLYWRRRKIASYKMPTEAMQLATFHQEFAMSVEGGFIELDKTPFDRDCLEALMRQKRDPTAIGLFRKDGDTIGLDTTAANDYHRWRIYAPPQQGEQYAMGIDTQNAYDSAQSDQTAAAILRFRDNKVCAIYTGRIPEHVMRQQLFLAYKWYWNCYYAPETAGMGYSLVRNMVEMGATNVYYWKREDASMPEPSRHPGWQTDGKTRPMMDNTFIEKLCHRDPITKLPDPNIIIQDAEALKEIGGLRRGDSGSLKSKHGKDDIFDAITIALRLFEDPYGSFHRKATNEPTLEQRRDFAALWQNNAWAASRAAPDLANI